MVVFCLILQLSLKQELTILTCGVVCAITNFWLCRMNNLFRVMIFATLVNFTLCANFCNLDSQITPMTENLQASTNLDGLRHGVEDKADCKSSWLWELEDKASQVIN